LILKVWATLDPNSHINFSIWTIQYTRIQGDGKIENQYRTVDKRFQMIAIAWDCNNRRVGEWYGAIPSLANYSGGFHFTSEAYRKFGEHYAENYVKKTLIFHHLLIIQVVFILLLKLTVNLVSIMPKTMLKKP
jgi:hypothetical protein